MEDDQQNRCQSPVRPTSPSRVTTGSEQTEPTTAHPATLGPSHCASGEAVGKKETAQLSVRERKFNPFWSPENLPPTLRWIPANWTWSKWKPVLRSALAAWISLLLFLIPQSMRVMGSAAFLIIISSFLSPPSEPFVVLLQRELAVLTFAACSWAWSCLGIKLADMARSHTDLTVSSANIIAGHYLEPAPTIIMAVFLFVGSFSFLYIKSCMVPGPLTFTYLFTCMLCMDTSLTVAALYPYPYYKIGQTIILPLTFHSAVVLALSLCFFPTSASATFIMRLNDVLSSLVTATKEHHQRLQQDVTSAQFSPSTIVTAIRKAESKLAALSSAARLQKFDIIYARFAPADYTRIHTLTKGLIVKASGMTVYYTLIDPTREKFPNIPVPSIPVTPASTSPLPSRHGTPAHDRPFTDAEKVNSHESSEGGIKGLPFHRHYSAPPQAHLQAAATHHNNGLHFPFRHHHTTHSHSLFHFIASRASRPEVAVGVFESLNYLNLEATHMSQPDSVAHVARANKLLSNSCHDLLKSCEHGLQGTCEWLGSVRANLSDFWLSQEEKKQIRMDRIKIFEQLRHELSLNLDEFQNSKRLAVLEPYRAVFRCADETSADHEIPSHRHLFHCYVYQYHLMRYAASIQDVLSEIIRLETEREMPRVWFAKIHWSKWIHRTMLESSEMAERDDDDDDPDLIRSLDPKSLTDLGRAVRRDPDALPPRNALERTVNWIYQTAKGLGGGNALFALKTSVLTIILSLPSFLESSAEFAYKNKFVWAVIMSQLTSARFRGDTTFSLLTRILSTIVGGIIGTLMWYISAGSGNGNAFGLAAVCFICFPFFFFIRLYWPVAPMTNLIIWVTTALVFGYSWQDTHLPSPSSPGQGINVAWRRFVLVVVGVLAAGAFSFLPPATTIRLYERKALAATTKEIGSIYCSTISFANTKKEDTALIVLRLLAVLNKLKRSILLKEHATYEVSLRGEWPAERYQRVLDLQIQISNLLSHLTSVLGQMEPAWAHAFLKRTRLSNADFQGDVLAVFSLISFSLRTGQPLPQVTPCPLLSRFMDHSPGLNIVDGGSEEDFGLPKGLTEETFESLQYMIFCVGVSTAYGVVTRLDRLMVAVKELVGEQYHIDGVGLPLYAHSGHSVTVEMRTPARTLP